MVGCCVGVLLFTSFAMTSVVGPLVYGQLYLGGGASARRRFLLNLALAQIFRDGLTPAHPMLAMA